MSTQRKFTREELADLWIRSYEIGAPSGGPIPFPSARHHREVERAARAIIAGRSPGVEGWVNKRILELAHLRVEREAARRDIEELRQAIEAKIVRITITEGDDEA